MTFIIGLALLTAACVLYPPLFFLLMFVVGLAILFGD